MHQVEMSEAVKRRIRTRRLGIRLFGCIEPRRAAMASCFADVATTDEVVSLIERNERVAQAAE